MVGHTDDSHPVYGDSVRARLHGGVLHLLGELVSDQERQKLISEARQFVGRGLEDVDARRLRVKRPDSPRGVLDQTIIAAYPNADIAEYALGFLRGHSRVTPKEAQVLRSDDVPKLDRLGDFAPDVCKALDAGYSVLIIRVDEADAFEAREMLDEDTRSLLTVVTPPVSTKDGG